MTQAALPPTPEIETQLEAHRRDLTGYCYRMLGSPFEAEDAVQETMLRAWRGYQGFEGRAALRSWLYRIATNVCLDMVKGRSHRAMPMDLAPARHLDNISMNILPEAAWIEPIPDTTLTVEADPAQVAVTRESIRLAFITALQHLPPRQRAVLILFEVMRWSAAEVAQLLDTTVASVNSALQRARATLQSRGVSADAPMAPLDAAQHNLLARYVRAFEGYDFPTLTALIREDAVQSMPPYEMWLTGRDDIFAWWVGPGIGCKDSRLLPTVGANGTVAFGQYKPAPNGGRDPWALMVVEPDGDRIGQLTFFLNTARLFPLFGLPLHLEADPDWDPFSSLRREP
jgi:RNA polymerase sigma-70 factor (ECF subfamily)